MILDKINFVYSDELQEIVKGNYASLESPALGPIVEKIKTAGINFIEIVDPRSQIQTIYIKSLLDDKSIKNVNVVLDSEQHACFLIEGKIENITNEDFVEHIDELLPYIKIFNESMTGSFSVNAYQIENDLFIVDIYESNIDIYKKTNKNFVRLIPDVLYELAQNISENERTDLERTIIELKTSPFAIYYNKDFQTTETLIRTTSNIESKILYNSDQQISFIAQLNRNVLPESFNDVVKEIIKYSVHEEKDSYIVRGSSINENLIKFTLVPGDEMLK